MAIERRVRICQLDEFVVSKQTMATHAWTNKKNNVLYDLSKAYTKPKAVIIAVSREYGLDHLQIFPNSVNRTKFLFFLDQLRNKFWTDDVLLVMDNLAIHRNREVRERMDDLGFYYTYTPVTSP